VHWLITYYLLLLSHDERFITCLHVYLYVFFQCFTFTPQDENGEGYQLTEVILIVVLGLLLVCAIAAVVVLYRVMRPSNAAVRPPAVEEGTTGMQ